MSDLPVNECSSDESFEFLLGHPTPHHREVAFCNRILELHSTIDKLEERESAAAKLITDLQTETAKLREIVDSKQFDLDNNFVVMQRQSKLLAEKNVKIASDRLEYHSLCDVLNERAEEVEAQDKLIEELQEQIKRQAATICEQQTMYFNQTVRLGEENRDQKLLIESLNKTLLNQAETIGDLSVANEELDAELDLLRRQNDGKRVVAERQYLKIKNLERLNARQAESYWIWRNLATPEQMNAFFDERTRRDTRRDRESA